MPSGTRHRPPRSCAPRSRWPQGRQPTDHCGRAEYASPRLKHWSSHDATPALPASPNWETGAAPVVRLNSAATTSQIRMKKPARKTAGKSPKKSSRALKSDRTLMLGLDGAEDGHSRPMTTRVKGQTSPSWFSQASPTASSISCRKCTARWRPLRRKTTSYLPATVGILSSTTIGR